MSEEPGPKEPSESEPSESEPSEAAQGDLSGVGWTVAAVALALTLLLLKAASLYVWIWSTHALALVLALEFLIRGARTSKRSPASKLVRSALARALCGSLLCMGAVEASGWLTPRGFYPPWYGTHFARGFAALTGLGWGAVWGVEAFFTRREESASRDLLGGVVGGGVAALLTAYATIQTFHLGRLSEGQFVLRDLVDFLDVLVSASGRDELCFFLALSVPIALTTLGRLRRLNLAALIGFSVLGSSALSGLFLSWAFVSFFGPLGAGVVATSLLSLLLPIAWHLLDRFRLPGAERRAADAAMDEVLRVDRIRRQSD